MEVPELSQITGTLLTPYQASAEYTQPIRLALLPVSGPQSHSIRRSGSTRNGGLAGELMISPVQTPQCVTVVWVGFLQQVQAQDVKVELSGIQQR